MCVTKVYKICNSFDILWKRSVSDGYKRVIFKKSIGKNI